jgi:hypothetical protein
MHNLNKYMIDQEFSLVDSVESTLAHWWVMVALMVLGGIIGWVIHSFTPPVYEADAVITVSMDFEKRELTQFEQDYAFGAARDVIASNPVMNIVVTDALEKGVSIDPARFHKDFFLEGRQSVWELRVRDRDPNIAAELSNIWVAAATKALDDALTHSIRADQIQAQINGLENCLAGDIPQVAPVPLDCKSLSQDMIQQMLQDQVPALLLEKKSSLGIISIMTFGLTELAIVPDAPSVYGQAGLVLAGAFIGLIVSFWITNLLYRAHRD